MKEVGIVVACRKCEECLKARKRSWTGRILAEMQTCRETWFATFTYGGGYDNAEAYVINTRHMQLMWKRLRKAGYRFRYLAVGEFGGKRRRAHFHAIIFWETPPPDVVLDKRIDWEHWPHGVCQFERPRSGQASAAYIMDYLDKDNLVKAELRFSQKPGIGHRYLVEYARRHARAGKPLFARGNIYTIPNNPNQQGKAFYYPVEKDRSIFNLMCEEYVAEFARRYPDRRLPMSPTFEEWSELEFDRIPDFEPASEEYLRRHEYRSDYELDAPHMETVITTTDGYVRVTKGNAVFTIDKPGGGSIWHVDLKAEAEAELRAAVLDERPAAEARLAEITRALGQTSSLPNIELFERHAERQRRKHAQQISRRKEQLRIGQLHNGTAQRGP